jgi:hypothetical protein
MGVRSWEYENIPRIDVAIVPSPKLSGEYVDKDIGPSQSIISLGIMRQISTLYIGIDNTCQSLLGSLVIRHHGNQYKGRL